MRFPYKKSKKIFNLVLGSLWLILFIADIVIDQKIDFFGYVKLFLAFVYLFEYLYGTSKAYFEITDQYIRTLKIFSKEIKISDLKEINKKFDEYEIKSDAAKIKISTQNLDKEYRDIFEEKIEEIRLQLNPNS